MLLLWGILTLVFSAIGVVYQVSKSIPGFLPVGKIWALGLKACIGTIQGAVSKFVMPFIASKVTWEKHVFITVSNFIMNFVIPGVVIMYLDTGSLAEGS